MKNLKYEMIDTMMKFLKKKEEIAKRPTGKRVRHIAEQNCYLEFIDILYKWIKELEDDENEVDS